MQRNDSTLPDGETEFVEEALHGAAAPSPRVIAQHAALRIVFAVLLSNAYMLYTLLSAILSLPSLWVQTLILRCTTCCCASGPSPWSGLPS